MTPASPVNPDGCVPSAEVAYNGRDEDCDGADLVDVDGDGWDAAVVGGEDCDDRDAGVHPGADELCDNLLDDDCDGTTDTDCVEGSADPYEPGGYAWVCGAPAPVAGVAVLAALLMVLGRRR